MPLGSESEGRAACRMAEFIFFGGFRASKVNQRKTYFDCITDHSTLEALAAEVGGNLRIYSPREQPYNGCAVVAAAARVIASRSESNLAAAPDPELFSYFNSAFDLVNVAALRAEENYEQLLVGDLVQTWFLRGGVEPVEGYGGVAGSVTYVDTVAGTITFKPLQSGEAPPITLPSEFLVPLKSQRDLIEPFR